MKIKEIVSIYMELRNQNQSVEDAASETMSRCSIDESGLVDAFNVAQLDLSQTEQEADVIREHRNELLSHFKS
jgi:hypothetical protein